MFRGSEAVLTPDGAVRHAEEPAKRARGLLARAVVAMDRARTSRRREDQDAALEGWRGLVAGRWSLVEQFDTDRKRFIVARKNDPRIAAPSALALPMKRMKESSAKELTVLGSASLLRQFSEHGLVDEFQFMIDPLVLGEGRSIFKGVKHRLNLKLVSTRMLRDGPVLLYFRPS